MKVAMDCLVADVDYDGFMQLPPRIWSFTQRSKDQSSVSLLVVAVVQENRVDYPL